MADAELTLGLWQDGGSPGDIAANLDRIGLAAGQARAQGVDLLIFPECFLTGYFRDRGVREVAARVDGPVRASLAGIAAATGVALLVGTYESSGDAVYNGAVCVTPEHGEIARYRKRALYGAWEKATFRRGTGPVVFEYLGLRIGVLICFDMEFPELCRELGGQGVDLIAVPTALMAPFDRIAIHMVPTRAMENEVFVAYANRTGAEAALRYVGRSSVVSPMGEVLADLTETETGLAVAPIRKTERDRARAAFCYGAELPEITSQGRALDEAVRRPDGSS